jgi:hypothetical protein
MDGSAAVGLTLPATRPSDVRYILMQSPDLTSWNELARCDGGAAWQGAGPLSTQGVAGDREWIRFATPGGTRHFFRLTLQRIVP